MSQETLAERARLSVKTVSALESGARRAPYRRTVEMLADALRLEPEDARRLTVAAVRPYRPRFVAAEVEPRGERGGKLPAEMSSFVGRDEDVAAVRTLLSESRLITLTGTGGIGKTRLAVRIADRCEGALGDAVFVDLAPLGDATLLAERVAAVLGLDERTGGSAADRVAAALREQRMLLVVDNCEHVLFEAASLVQRIVEECPNVAVLATSRERLNLRGERVYSVPPLASPGAVRLFEERARAVAPFALSAANQPVVAEICRRLDGIPLAIELAAARVKSLSLADIATLLDDRFRLLVNGPRTAQPRQQTLRAAIDWSFEALSASERNLLLRVSVFAGGWTLDAASAICGDDSLDVLETLSSLVERSLVVADVQRTPTRYRLLESTRAYALEKLEDAGTLPEASLRMAEWMGEFCDRAADALWTMGLGPWLVWTGDELDNARAVLAWSHAEPGRAALGLRVSSGLGALWRFGAMREEGVRELEAGLARADASVPKPIEARAWRELAWIGVGTRTLSAAERAVALDASGDDRFALALSRRALALSLARAGRMVEAEAAVDLADAALRDLGLSGSTFYAQVLAMRAISAKEQGRIEEARRLFTNSLSIYVERGDELLAAVARLNLAELEFAAHDDVRALELVQDARSTYRAAGLLSADALAVVNEAAYRLMLGDSDGARLAARDGVAFSQRGQSGGALVPALQVLAALAASRGDPERGALLIGFVDAWNASRGYELEATERRTYAAATAALRSALSDADRARLSRAGANLSEGEAMTIALEIR